MVKRLVDAAELKLADDVLDLTLETRINIDEVGGVPVHGMIPPPTAVATRKTASSRRPAA
jgi:hypothetical protein